MPLGAVPLGSVPRGCAIGVGATAVAWVAPGCKTTGCPACGKQWAGITALGVCPGSTTTCSVPFVAISRMALASLGGASQTGAYANDPSGVLTCCHSVVPWTMHWPPPKWRGKYCVHAKIMAHQVPEVATTNQSLGAQMAHRHDGLNGPTQWPMHC